MSNAEENRVRGARASHGNNRRNTGSLSLVSRRGERVMRRAGAGERELEMREICALSRGRWSAWHFFLVIFLISWD